MPHRTFLCRLIFAAIFSVSVVNVFTTWSAPSFFLRYSRPAAFAHDHIECPQSEIADDVLVVLRTGATESHQKVPVHFRTTLRCVPHFVIVSDLDEEIEGHAVHNVLGGVSEDRRKEHEDFKLYNRLQEHGRKGIDSQQVITTESGSSKGDYLNTANDGWKLDKWKFLPMVDEAYRTMPSAKWFVFIETDTFLGWNNLLEYLSSFDSSKPYYIGKHLYINDVEFGYGGAGFVLSNPAVQKVMEQRSVRARDYEEFTATHWVGDCALGKVMEDAKVPLHRAFPHFQGDSPATMDPAVTKIDRNAWCYPVITYHHVSPSEIEDLWRFEQAWTKEVCLTTLILYLYETLTIHSMTACSATAMSSTSSCIPKLVHQSPTGTTCRPTRNTMHTTTSISRIHSKATLGNPSSTATSYVTARKIVSSSRTNRDHAASRTPSV
jgi:hypothetical protein